MPSLCLPAPLEAAFAHAPEGIARIDRSGRLAGVNPAYARAHGCAPEGMTGRRWARQLHPADRPRARAAARRARRGGAGRECLRGLRADGSAFHQQVTLVAVTDAHGAADGYFCFMQDVDARMRAEAELREAHRRAEELGRLKAALLANMSHEIRTPLAPILGFSTILAQEVDENHRELVRMIEQNGKRLLDTLNAVLEVARLQAEKVEVCRERVDVVRLVGDVMDVLRDLAREKTIALHLTAPEPEVFAVADAVYLDRVFMHLLGNAVKFTEAGEVDVVVEETAGEVVVRIRDTGVGIGPEYLPELFDVFSQESAGFHRSHQGNGLGLAITNRLVSLMGGRIAVESEKHEGTTFTVWLPNAPPPVPRRE